MAHRPDFTDPNEAVRVSSFMEDAEVGRWRLMHFTITEREYRQSVAIAAAQGGAQGEMRMGRTIPPGDYITLLRKATPFEMKDIEEERVVDSHSPHPGYVPIMSDTPAEVNEHMHAWNYAHGNVLITGLGLGVLVSGLLTRESVEHITVVEIDRDVIALTGHYYADHPKVTIVNADAVRYAEELALASDDPPMFDYAWHDIWSHIADRNLEDDALAEHGISYRTMFEAWEPFAVMQGAWAYPEALAMREAKQIEKKSMDEWAREFIAADDAKRVDMLEDFHIRRMLNLKHGAHIPPELRTFARQQLKVRENCELQLADRGSDEMAADMQRILDTTESDKDPMDRPNDVPEANVA